MKPILCCFHRGIICNANGTEFEECFLRMVTEGFQADNTQVLSDKPWPLQQVESSLVDLGIWGSNWISFGPDKLCT